MFVIILICEMNQKYFSLRKCIITRKTTRKKKKIQCDRTYNFKTTNIIRVIFKYTFTLHHLQSFYKIFFFYLLEITIFFCAKHFYEKLFIFKNVFPWVNVKSYLGIAKVYIIGCVGMYKEVHTFKLNNKV